MAIIVEEEKVGRINLIQIASWLIILIIVVAAVYYVFFRKPPLVDVANPQSVQNAQSLSEINVNPESITNNPLFNSLQEYVVMPPPSQVGRPNPFSPF